MKYVMSAFFIAFAILAGLTATSVGPALGSPACQPREVMERILREKYSEEVVSRGISSAGSMVEVYATEDGSTFTIILTTPKKLSCLVNAGKDWQIIDFDRKKIGNGV